MAETSNSAHDKAPRVMELFSPDFRDESVVGFCAIAIPTLTRGIRIMSQITKQLSLLSLKRPVQGRQVQRGVSVSRSGVSSQDEKIILFLGVTGCGKSSFIKALTDHNDVEVGHGLCSETSIVRAVRTTIESVNFLLVDTPGFNDTFRSDEEILTEITNWLATTYKQGRKITGIIYLHPINQPRMEGSSLLNFTVMQKLCGSETFENVILASTFWDVVDEESGARRENELCQTPQFWGCMKRNGSKVTRIHDYGQSKGILLQLAAKPVVALQIQREMVEEEKTLSDTAAGLKLNQDLRRIQEEHRQQKRVMEERAEAELRLREKENQQRVADELARQKAAHQLQKELIQARQRTEQRIQQEKLAEKRRLALQAEREAEHERQRLRQIQIQKERLAQEQKRFEAARLEIAEQERKRRELIGKNVLAARHRLEMKTQRDVFLQACNRWTVRANTFTLENQAPDFVNWCDRCFHLIRFGGFRQCFTCVLQICESCWGAGDHCMHDGKTHRVATTPRRIQPPNCCVRLAQPPPGGLNIRCDRFGCGRAIRGFHFHCCLCAGGDYDICLECVISGFTCFGNHRLHPTVNWPMATTLPHG